MAQFITGNLANQLIFSFAPLEIEPVFEGYQLTSEPIRQRAINLYQLLRSRFMGRLGGVGPMVVITFFVFFQFILTLFSVVWPILIPLLIFIVVYGSLKLIFDPEFRFGVGAQFSLAPGEVIFSHYPLRVGEEDRLTFRRQIKDNWLTRWFNVNHFPDQGRLQVSLLCAERVSYTSHDEEAERMTEVAVIYEDRIHAYSLLGGDRQVNAYFDCQIPHHLPPSFEGKNNQIRWLLKIEESYPNVIGQQTTYLTFVVDP